MMRNMMQEYSSPTAVFFSQNDVLTECDLHFHALLIKCWHERSCIVVHFGYHENTDRI